MIAPVMPSKDARYYAVLDPFESVPRMLFWRETVKQGRRAWPKKGIWAGPEFTKRLRREKPPEKRRLWVEWHLAVDARIEADRDQASAQFAAWNSRCCFCGRVLTDPATKVYGIGPECSSGMPPEFMASMAERMRVLVGGAQ